MSIGTEVNIGSDPDSTKTSVVDLTIRDGVANITLNRPSRLNAANRQVAGEFSRAMRQAEDNATVRVVTITGAGAAFMAGGDVAEFDGNLSERSHAVLEQNDRFHEVIRMIRRIRVPVVAAVHGAVAGGGVAVVLAADLAIAADDTRFVPAYMSIAATPDAGCSWNLVRLMGRKLAFEFYLLGRPISANEAAVLGLINRVVPRNSLLGELKSITDEIIKGPAFAQSRLKALFTRAEEAQFEAQLDAERASFLDCAARPEFEKAVSAFLRKEKLSRRG